MLNHATIPAWHTPRHRSRATAMDHLRPVESDHRIGQRVFVAVAGAACRGRYASLGEPTSVAHVEMLRSSVRVMDNCPSVSR